jgi:hypothetical protein
LLLLVPLLPNRIVFRQTETTPVPTAIANEILSGDGTLRTPVGSYTDCSGLTPIPPFEAALWPCVPGRLYFVGHNPGVFTPLMHMRVGDVLTYIDRDGLRHLYRIVRVEDWPRAGGSPPPASASVVAQFQTCVTPDATLDRIVDAVAVAVA